MHVYQERDYQCGIKRYRCGMEPRFGFAGSLPWFLPATRRPLRLRARPFRRLRLRSCRPGTFADSASIGMFTATAFATAYLTDMSHRRPSWSRLPWSLRLRLW
jgi:hypothetical protein